jgi:hypothetical protein
VPSGFGSGGRQIVRGTAGGVGAFVGQTRRCGFLSVAYEEGVELTSDVLDVGGLRPGFALRGLGCDRCLCDGAGEVGSVEDGAAQVCASQICADEDGVAQVGVDEVRVAQIGG